MARYKHHDRTQCRMIAVDFDRQILPGSFESVLDQLIDRRFRFSSLDTRYRNDETGAPAFDPRTLLKIILYAYSCGLYSSRAIEEACRTNVTFMALSGCIACLLRKHCLGADTARRRNLHIINNRIEATHASRMAAKIDTLRGRLEATPIGCSIAWSTTSKRSPMSLISDVCDRTVRESERPFEHRIAKNVDSPGSDPEYLPQSLEGPG